MNTAHERRMNASDSPPGPRSADFVRQRFELLIDSLEDYAVFMISLAGEITSWNAGVVGVLVYSEAVFVGLPFANFLTP
jgi:hypothetical protein